MTWQLNALVELHWRSWDDEWVAFDVGSGQTHQMDSLTATALMVLADAPAATIELAAQAAETLSVPNDQDLSVALSGAVEGLHAAGLIGSLTR